MKKNIALLMGGYSNEFEISIKSGKTVSEYLNHEKYNIYNIIITDKNWYWESDSGHKISINKSDFSVNYQNKNIYFDLIFNTIHGTPGENGLLAAYFELLGIKQTSTDFYTAAITFHKHDLLKYLKPIGIQSAPSLLLRKGQNYSIHTTTSDIGLPCFVKANGSGSSHGVYKVITLEQLKPAISNAFTYDNEVLIEKALLGTEVSVGVIPYKNKIIALPLTELVSNNDFFDYNAKYLGESQEITPARLSKKLTDEIQDLSIKIYKYLNLKGYSRSEFIIVNDIPFLLEVNTTPGLTKDSILPQQARAYGIELEELFQDTIDRLLTT